MKRGRLELLSMLLASSLAPCYLPDSLPCVCGLGGLQTLVENVTWSQRPHYSSRKSTGMDGLVSVDSCSLLPCSLLLVVYVVTGPEPDHPLLTSWPRSP